MSDWESVYRIYYKPLLIYALSFTHDIDSAKDLVSETFVKAILSYENPSINGMFKAWLCTVLRNLYIDEYRKSKFVVADNSCLDNMAIDDNIIDNLFLEQRKRWVYKEKYKLDRLNRDVILLSINFDLNDVQIAKQLNISVENVRVIPHRIKLKLIKLAKKEGYYEG